MLNSFQVSPTIPVTDLERAKDFYQKTLGLQLDEKKGPDGLLFHAGQGSSLYIYQRGPSKADHTLASFLVDNLEEVMDTLIQKGVTFEHYNLPNLVTDEKGIATMGDTKGAWFKDPDGNILAITQMGA